MEVAAVREEMELPVCPHCQMRDRVWMREGHLRPGDGVAGVVEPRLLRGIEPLLSPVSTAMPWSIPSILVVGSALFAATIADLGIWPHPAGTLTPGRIAMWTFIITAVAGIVVLLNTLTWAVRQQQHVDELATRRRAVTRWEDRYQCARCMDVAPMATITPFPSVHLLGFRYYPGFGYRRG